MANLDHIFFNGAESAFGLAGNCHKARAAGTNLHLPPPRTSTPMRAWDHAEPRLTDPFWIWLLDCAGIEPSTMRPSVLSRRTAACLRALRATSLEEARAVLERNPGLLPLALNSILIGVSEFFRDPEVFQSLRDQVLPALAREWPQLRVYSAGCSEGQELYSVAMLLAEMGKLEKSDLLGVDCREHAVAAARTSSYSPQETNKIEGSLRERYFSPGPSALFVEPALRARTRWQMADVLKYREETCWQMILCRNLAIYMQPEAAGQLWRMLFSQLAFGGVLVVGRASRPDPRLPLRRISACIYQKTS